MTAQPFKFRHLDAIVGAFVLGAVGVAVIALILVGSVRQWFTGKEKLYAQTAILAHKDPQQAKEDLEFYEELSQSLQVGTPVELSGRTVGSVLQSSFTDNRLKLHLSIEREAAHALRLGPDGARALVKVPIAPFMGQTRILLKPGRGLEFSWKDSQESPIEIPIEPPRDSTKMAQAVLRDLESNLGPMMSAITGLVQESRDLVKEIRAQQLPQQAGELIAGLRERQVPQRLDALLARVEALSVTVAAIAATGQGIADDAKQLSGGLVAGKGIAGKALSDEQFGTDLARLASDLQAITAELRKAAPTLPGLSEGAGTLLDEVQRLVDGLNRHWLMRSYTDPGNGERIMPNGVVDPPPAVEAKP
jgi:hypothetical protein